MGYLKLIFNPKNNLCSHTESNYSKLFQFIYSLLRFRCVQSIYEEGDGSFMHWDSNKRAPRSERSILSVGWYMRLYKHLRMS
jgi:hypothetical protein